MLKASTPWHQPCLQAGTFVMLWHAVLSCACWCLWLCHRPNSAWHVRGWDDVVPVACFVA